MTVKKILILAANPLGTTSLQLDEEVRAIEQALERARLRDRFEIKTKLAATPKDLRRALLDFEPNIVHFSGHGSGAEGLLLVNDTLQQYLKQNNDGSWYVFNQQQIQFVSSSAIAGLLELFADFVECVVLNACYSEEQALAISAFINYTIGMNAQINDTAARKFSEGFYDGLGAGKSYEFAFKLGKNAIESEAAHLSPSDIPVMLRKTQITKSSPAPTVRQIVNAAAKARKLFERGYAKEQSGQYRQALIDYTEAIRIDPSYIIAYAQRGCTFQSINDESIAKQDFQVVIGLQPHTSDDYIGRGIAKCGLGDNQGAINDFNEALSLKPNDAYVYKNRGIAKYRLGDKEGAISDYNQAIRLKPDYTDAYYNRGILKLQLEDKQGAIFDLSEVIRLKPYNPRAYMSRGLAKYELEDYQGSRIDFQKAAEIFKQQDDVENYNLMIKSIMMMNT